jgi:hypothetical protein
MRKDLMWVAAVFVLLLVLRLTGVAHIGWVWVTMPLWLPFAIWLLVVIVAGLLVAATMFVTDSIDGRE